MDKKKSILFTAVLATLLVAVGAGMYLALKNPPLKPITVISPAPNDSVSSPIAIEGTANSGWTVFEGVAGTATLYDANGNQLGQAQLKADTDWTKPPVHFTASLAFSASSTGSGHLEFLSDNPSGDPAKQQTYSLPVSFP